MSAPRVLLTRPQADSAALAVRLKADGWAPLIWPLLDIIPTGAAASGADVQAVLLSSANAARALPAAALGKVPPHCLCVGSATAAAAAEAGYRGVEAAAGDVAALADLAQRRLRAEAGPLLFLRGAQVAGDLAGTLGAKGFAVREVVVYRAEAATKAPPDVARALAAGGVAAALFYSPRTARAFADLAAPWRAGLAATRAVAISAKAAAPLQGLGFGAVSVAATPDEPGLLAALGAATGGLDRAAPGGYDGAITKEAES